MDGGERKIPAIADVGREIAASKKTVVREQGEARVIKEFVHIYDMERLPGESDENYRLRRLNESIRYINKQLASGEKAKRFLSDQINAPPDFHLIADGKDGFPVPLMIQEKVPGQTLREVDPSSLTSEQKENLDLLLQASLDAYRKHGKFLDLIGTVAGETDNVLLKVRQLWRPLDRSSNIMISPDGTISVIDLRLFKLAFPRDIIKMLFLFSYLYGKKLEKLIKKEAA